MFEAEKKALKRIVKSLQVSLGDELQTVIAFGSRIRGDFRADSDFDVLIVVKSEEIFFKEREFRTGFLINVINEGRFLYGKAQ